MKNKETDDYERVVLHSFSFYPITFSSTQSQGSVGGQCSQSQSLRSFRSFSILLRLPSLLPPPYPSSSFFNQVVMVVL